MCGIAGYILEKESVDARLGLGIFLPSIRQRGPDDEGACLISRAARAARVFMTPLSSSHIISCGDCLRPDVFPLHDAALFHARFSIIDPSVGGHQPFVSRDGALTAVFNGEIYNYLELRDELSGLGVSFRTCSDTEILVEGYRLWGEKLWQKINGFWAVVIYDRSSDALIFSRDRLGIAPLYYRQTAEGFFFASLIQPLVDVCAGAEIDTDVLRGFIDTGLKDHNCTTVYRDIKSFPSGASVIFSSGVFRLIEANVQNYWFLPSAPLTIDDISFDEAVSRLRTLLFDAVKLRLRADVPLAFELSGGLDSSSIVAAACEIGARKPVVYTLKVHGRDEEPFARALTERYLLDYRVMSGLENDFVSQAEFFSGVMEEPYDTPGNFLHHLMLKEMKRQGRRVVLTGAGGDETLAGYEGSFWPGIYADACAKGGRARWEADRYEFFRRFKTWPGTARTLAGYAASVCRRLRLRRSSGLPVYLSSARDLMRGYKTLSPFEQRRYHFLTGLLPYYLRSTDHYTMSVPIEHRFPFLDYRLVEFGVCLPSAYLFKDGWTKYVLRKAMEPYLPAKVLWRRVKMGFPFYFQKYFLPRKEVFGKYFEEFERLGMRGKNFDNYHALALRDPVCLWRILSVGIWLRNRRLS